MAPPLTFSARILANALIVSIMLVPAAQAQDSASVADGNFRAVRAILQTPEADIDLAKVEFSIEHMIDPSVDVASGVNQLDVMADGIRRTLPLGASSRLTLDALRYHLYQPSPWNDKRHGSKSIGWPERR